MRGFLLSIADQPPAPPKDFYLSTARTTALPMYVNDKGTIVDKTSDEYAAWYAETYGEGTVEDYDQYNYL